MYNESRILPHNAPTPPSLDSTKFPVNTDAQMDARLPQKGYREPRRPRRVVVVHPLTTATPPSLVFITTVTSPMSEKSGTLRRSPLHRGTS